MRNVNYHNAAVTARERNMGKYDNMIDMPRPEPPRERMSASERAAQFAPFSALAGFGEAIGEAGRRFDENVEGSERFQQTEPR